MLVQNMSDFKFGDGQKVVVFHRVSTWHAEQEFNGKACGRWMRKLLENIGLEVSGVVVSTGPGYLGGVANQEFVEMCRVCAEQKLKVIVLGPTRVLRASGYCPSKNFYQQPSAEEWAALKSLVCETEVYSLVDVRKSVEEQWVDYCALVAAAEYAWVDDGPVEWSPKDEAKGKIAYKLWLCGHGSKCIGKVIDVSYTTVDYWLEKWSRERVPERVAKRYAAENIELVTTPGLVEV